MTNKSILDSIWRQPSLRKPRIRRDTRGTGGWECYGGIFSGYGKTPERAYDAWCRITGMRAKQRPKRVLVLGFIGKRSLV